MRGLDFRRDRRRTTALTAMLVIAGLGWSAAGPSPAAAAFGISLDSIVGGLESPTQITNAGDGTDRLFVVEQRGTVRVIQGGVLQPGFFLDIRSKVEDGGERGLLGLAFSPSFETNRQLFVYYTRNGGDIVVTRFTTNAPRTDADESTHRPLFLIEHSAQTNHNGGGLTFGPNGLLYIAVGDGGGSGDPRNNAQRKTTLLGKILRVNVNGTKSGPFHHYSNPAANPFKGSTPGLDEIWAYGLRNPWRISFDRVTGQLFIGDVGQGRWEEIDREKPGIRGGRNYGWNAMEGFHCYTASKCPLSGDTLPVAEYSPLGRQLFDHRRLRLSRPDPDGTRRAVRLRRLLQRTDLDDAEHERGHDPARRHQPEHHVLRRVGERRAVRGDLVGHRLSGPDELAPQGAPGGRVDARCDGVMSSGVGAPRSASASVSSSSRIARARSTPAVPPTASAQ